MISISKGCVEFFVEKVHWANNEGQRVFVELKMMDEDKACKTRSKTGELVFNNTLQLRTSSAQVLMSADVVEVRLKMYTKYGMGSEVIGK